jgi:hypothetical protein
VRCRSVSPVVFTLLRTPSPLSARRRLDSFETLAAGVKKQVALGLIRTDIGESDTNLDLCASKCRLRRHKTNLVPPDAAFMLKRVVLPCLVAAERPRELSVEIETRLLCEVHHRRHSTGDTLASLQRVWTNNRKLRIFAKRKTYMSVGGSRQSKSVKPACCVAVYSALDDHVCRSTA